MNTNERYARRMVRASKVTKLVCGEWELMHVPSGVVVKLFAAEPTNEQALAACRNYAAGKA